MKKFLLVCLVSSTLILSGYDKASESTSFPVPTIQLVECASPITIPIYHIPLTKNQQLFIVNECNKCNIDPTLIYSIIYVESNFNSKLIANHDYGLMQLNNLGTLQWLAKELKINNFNPFNFEDNVRAGVYYISYLRDYWHEEGFAEEDTTILTILSYNLGITGTWQYIKKHGIVANNYVKTVLNYKRKLEVNYHGKSN